MIPFLGLFVGFGAFFAGLGFRTRSGGPLVFAGLFGGLPLLIALVLFFSASVWTLLPLALAMFYWGHSKGRSDYWRQALRGSPGAADSLPWTMGPMVSSSGGSSGGPSGDSGSSGGDFGGGSSGGGGASGSW